MAGLPGSLECLLGGITDLFSAMNSLNYELDLSDSFDSGQGSDYDNDTEGDQPCEEQEITFEMCTSCAGIVCKEVENCLQRSSKLIVSSSLTLRRLRRVCYHTRANLDKATEKLATQDNVVAQLEGSLKHVEKKAESWEKECYQAKEDRVNIAKDLQDAKLKVNENYKLVAELSNENLRVVTDKMKALQSVESLMREQTRLRTELRGLKKALIVAQKGGAGTRHKIYQQQRCGGFGVSSRSADQDPGNS